MTSLLLRPQAAPPAAAPVVTPAGRHARRHLVSINAVKEVFMPALSSTMQEGKVVSWLKSPGDKVKKGESVVVVESDKADMDVESFNEGFMGGIVVQEGGVASVGAPIAYIAESEAELEEAKSKAGSGNGVAAPPAQPEAPKEEKVEQKVLAPAVDSQAAAPPPAAQPRSEQPAPPPTPAPAPQKRADGRIIATPYAKKLAKELGVDLSSLAGSGPNGRITASDVEATRGNGATAKAPPSPAAALAPAAAPAASAKPAAPSPPPSAPAPAPVSTTVSELKGTTKPFTSMQAAVSKNMLESLKVPEFRISYTIVTDKLDILAKKLKPKGVTMTGLLAKAAGLALAQHPIMYAACTKDGNGITYAEHVNVAVAVSMPDGGLITPVIKDADSTDIYQISRVWSDLVKRARSKQLAPDEYHSGNFTISNLGMFGADKFDAILPPGTTGIIAVGTSKPTVTADASGRIGVERQMTVNLTCDHRLAYGTDAAEFLSTLKKIIESPDQLTF